MATVRGLEGAPASASAFAWLKWLNSSSFTSAESFHVVVRHPEHETLEVKSCPLQC